MYFFPLESAIMFIMLTQNTEVACDIHFIPRWNQPCKRNHISPGDESQCKRTLNWRLFTFPKNAVSTYSCKSLFMFLCIQNILVIFSVYSLLCKWPIYILFHKYSKVGFLQSCRFDAKWQQTCWNDINSPEQILLIVERFKLNYYTHFLCS